MEKLKGKITLITGGNSGMGLAAARLFAQEGATVIITGRRPKDVDEAARSIGPAAFGVQGDVSNMADLDRLFSLVKEKYGHLDVIFANAGIARGAPIGQVTEEVFDQLFAINVKGLFFTVQKALPLLSDGASIILNSSIAWEKGMEALSVYSATKSAVRSFARGWTTDLKARNIRVNSLSPGPIDTPIMGKMGLTHEQARARKQAFAQMVPLGRIGRPEEIAAAALFLACDDSSFITGVDLAVDGGMAQV